MGSLRHRIAHLLGVNGGFVDSSINENGEIVVWFQCSGCGQVMGAHVARTVDMSWLGRGHKPLPPAPATAGPEAGETSHE